MSDPVNPYSPPASSPNQDAIDDLVRASFVPVGKLTRTIIFFIDSIGLLFFIGLCSAFAQPLLPDVARVPLVGWGLLMIYGFIYYAGFEVLIARTPGKILTGSKVVDYDGGNPSLKQILKRTAGRFIPFDQVSMTIELDRTWHDMISRTRVARKSG